MASQTKERRRDVRALIQVEAWLGHEHNQKTERTLDLSESGAFITTMERSHSVGQLIAVRLRLPDGGLNSGAIVRNVRPGHGAGVEFLGLMPDDQARLRASLRSR